MNAIEQAVEQIIIAIGENPERDGLLATPQRYQKFLEEFLAPNEFQPTTFTNDGYDEMVVQRDISFYSICEHHLLPFFGTGIIAYIPHKKIIGLSKLARTLDHFSRRLQNQERITTQVADFLVETIEPKGVGVILNARHLCIEMRGIKKGSSHTTTSCVRGLMKKNHATRSEFLQFT